MVTIRYQKIRRPRYLGQDSGKFDEAKGKTLLMLRAYEQQYGRWSMNVFLTARQIHEETGVNLETLYASLRRWWKKCHYVRRNKTRTIYGEVVYTYAIAERGKRWLEGFGKYLPLARFAREIEQWQRERQEELRRKVILREEHYQEILRQIQMGKSPFTAVKPTRYGTTKTKILHVLSRSPRRPLTAAECYARTGVPVETCLVSLNRMSHDGLVRRVHGSTGNGVYYYQITPEGHQYLDWAKKKLLYRQIMQQVQDWQTRVETLLAGLAEDQSHRFKASALQQALLDNEEDSSIQSPSRQAEY